MAHSSSSYNNNSSMLKSAVTCENINEYNLDFSPDGIEEARAIGNIVNSEAIRSYEVRFKNLVNGRNEKIRCIDIGPQPFFKSYSEIIEDDNTSKELLKNNIHLINEETILSLTQLSIDEEVNDIFSSNESYRKKFKEDLEIFRIDIKDHAMKIMGIIEKKENEKECLVTGSLDPNEGPIGDHEFPNRFHSNVECNGDDIQDHWGITNLREQHEQP
ncbi:unnamed protein product, partial [Rotaria magnacalcarata]